MTPSTTKLPTPSSIGNYDHGPTGMPALPFELQLLIIYQIHPNHIFTLRSVSQSWNNMLSNPSLLDVIHKKIPFLTSAPDLISRMKRRMRMARGEPVWVKPLREVFPWASRLLHNMGPYHSRWGGFSGGWLVTLEERSPLAQEGLDQNKCPLIISLTIGSFHGAVEIDILDVMKEVNPDVYREWVGEGW